jgi:radical SAM superfamily enzyme YgiQ (UPF0313 family)
MELDELNQKYKDIYILDDNLLVNKKRVEKLMDLIIERDYDFDFEVAVVIIDAANKDLFKKMKKAGVKGIAMGIESGNQDVLDFYNKKITLDQAKKAVKLSRKFGFYTTGNFIVGAPIETEEYLKRTFKMATKLPFDAVLFTPLQYLTGSELWEEAVEEGKIKEDEYVVKADSKRGLGNFSHKELEKWCINSARRFLLRPRYLVDQFFYTILRKDFIRFKVALKLLHDNI